MNKFANLDTETSTKLYQSNADLERLLIDEVYTELCERGVFPRFIFIDIADSKEKVMSDGSAIPCDKAANDYALRKYGKIAVFDGIEETSASINSRRYRLVNDEERERTDQEIDRGSGKLPQ